MKRWRWLAGRDQDGFGEGSASPFPGEGFGFGFKHDRGAGIGNFGHLDSDGAGCPDSNCVSIGTPTARKMLLTETGVLYQPSASGLIVEVR